MSLLTNGDIKMTSELKTLPQAAKTLGVPTSTLRRAAKQRLIPTYKPFNSRIRVRVSEIQAVISEMRVGGSK